MTSVTRRFASRARRFRRLAQRRGRAERDRRRGGRRSDPQCPDDPAAGRGLAGTASRGRSGTDRGADLHRGNVAIRYHRAEPLCSPATRRTARCSAGRPRRRSRRRESATYRTDPRFEAAKANEFGMLYQLNPELLTMHHDPPDMPVECLVPMTPHFVTLSLVAHLSDPDLHPLGSATPITPRCTDGMNKCCGCLQSGRRAWPLAAQESAARDRARGACRAVSRCPIHRHPPRPGDVRRVDRRHGPGVRRHVRTAAACSGVRSYSGRRRSPPWATASSASGANTATTVSSTCPIAA